MSLCSASAVPSGCLLILHMVYIRSVAQRVLWATVFCEAQPQPLWWASSISGTSARTSGTPRPSGRVLSSDTACQWGIHGLDRVVLVLLLLPHDTM